MATTEYVVRKLRFSKNGYGSIEADSPLGNYEIMPASEHAKKYLGVKWEFEVRHWYTNNDDYYRVAVSSNINEAINEANKEFASMVSDVVNNYVVFYEKDSVK